MSQKCNTIGSKIKSFLAYINIFDIPRLTREISSDVKLIRDKYDETIKAIDDYKKELELERDKRARERNLFLSVLDHLDDMVWAKDLEGKYIVANKAFREKFCYGITWDELQGMTDVELAKKFKKQVGERITDDYATDSNGTHFDLCDCIRYTIFNIDRLFRQTKIIVA